MFGSLYEDAYSLSVDLLRRHPTVQKAVFVGCLIALTVGAGYGRPFDSAEPPRQAAAVLFLAGLVVLGPVLRSFIGRPVQTLAGELEPIRAERKEIEERLQGESEPDVYSSLDLNLNHLSEYYAINKSQARASFRMGVTSVLLGLVVLIFGVGLIYRGTDSQVTVAMLSTIAGVLSQFIGGSCFYLYKKAQDQSGHFYDQLTKLQGTMLAVRLCEQLSTVEIRDATLQSLIDKLVGSSGVALKPPLPRPSS
jgi:hypothetical protein